MKICCHFGFALKEPSVGGGLFVGRRPRHYQGSDALKKGRGGSQAKHVSACSGDIDYVEVYGRHGAALLRRAFMAIRLFRKRGKESVMCSYAGDPAEEVCRGVPEAGLGNSTSGSGCNPVKAPSAFEHLSGVTQRATSRGQPFGPLDGWGISTRQRFNIRDFWPSWFVFFHPVF